MTVSMRWRAFLIHLAGSTVMGVGALILVFWVWCPGLLAEAVGVSRIIFMLLGVDVVLGPVLTAIVYKPGKKSLVLDLCVIVAVQLAAFGYGVWTMAVARPAWIVYSGYRFDVVQANSLDARFMSETPERYKSPPWWGPQWVAAQMPSDPKKRNQLVMDAVGGGADMPQRPDLYVPLAQASVSLREKAIPLDVLAGLHGSEVLRTLKKRWPEADAYFPLVARGRNMIVLVQRAEAKVLGIEDIQPVK